MSHKRGTIQLLLVISHLLLSVQACIRSGGWMLTNTTFGEGVGEGVVEEDDNYHYNAVRDSMTYYDFTYSEVF